MTSTTPLLAVAVAIPGGDLNVVVDPTTGVVRGAGYGDLAAVIGLLPADAAGRGVEPVDPAEAPGPVAAVVAALEAYARGDLLALDTIEVDQPGGPFTQRAWAAIRRVRGTATYGELAAAAGNPAAAQAAGSACTRNHIAVIVPCHRIVRAGTDVHGLRHRSDWKAVLLAHEAAATKDL